jgi:hypothetical protein
MKNLFPFFFTVIVLFWSVSAIAAEKKSGAIIESIHFLEENGIEIIEVKLSSRIIPAIFELNGENPRVVCDLTDTGYPAQKKRVIGAEGALIKRVRIGLHHTPVIKTRLVIDLQKNVRYSVAHDFREEKNVLSIRISPKPDEQDDAGPVAATPKGETTEAGVPTSSVPPAPAVESEEPRAAGIVQKNEEEADVSFQKGIDVIQESTASGAEEQGAVSKEEGKVDPVLLDVSYESSTNGKEMVLFRLNGFHPPIVFSTEKDDLLVVCDFLDAVLAIGIDPVLETNGTYIERVKVSAHRKPDKVRVVLELSNRYSYDLKQVFFKEDNLFVVIINNLGEKTNDN